VATERAPRQKAFLKATIRFQGGNVTADCLVRNISTSGARVDVDRMVAIPQEFELDIPQRGALLQCRLAWRTDDRAGVEFVDSRSSGQSTRWKARWRKLRSSKRKMARSDLRSGVWLRCSPPIEVEQEGRKSFRALDWSLAHASSDVACRAQAAAIPALSESAGAPFERLLAKHRAMRKNILMLVHGRQAAFHTLDMHMSAVTNGLTFTV
jgi:hypothetical protein